MNGSELAGRCGSWAVVTGASDGIGRAFAVALAAEGLNLVLVARRAALLDTLADELRATGAPDVCVEPLDFTRPDAAAALGRATDDLDVGLLVAAAGFGTAGPLIGNPLASELEMVDVNCRAVAALAHLYGTRFVARGRGGLVLMSSLLAFQGVAGAANYAATKAYVQVLAEGLRAELGPSGVEVIASAPGPVRSGFERRADMRMGMGERPEVVARATLAALGRRTTVRPGRLAKLLEGSLATLPRVGRTAVMSRVMAGMIRHRIAGHRGDGTTLGEAA